MTDIQKDISWLMEDLLGVGVKVKLAQSEDTLISKQLFCKFIRSLDTYTTKANNLLQQHSLDLDPLVLDLHTAIEHLLEFTFDVELSGIIYHYLRSRNEKGIVKFKLENKTVTVKSPEDLFDFLEEMEIQMMLGDQLDS